MGSAEAFRERSAGLRLVISCGWARAPSGHRLQCVSKSLPGESPPATIIANVLVLIGSYLRSPTIDLGCCWNKNLPVLLFSCQPFAFDLDL